MGKLWSSNVNDSALATNSALLMAVDIICTTW